MKKILLKKLNKNYKNKRVLYEPMVIMFHELKRLTNSAMHLKVKKKYWHIKSDSWISILSNI